MNGKDYIMTQVTMVEMSKKISKLDLDSFLRCISNAETIAPITDPTLYNRAIDNLRAVRGLAEAFKQVQAQFTKLEQAIVRTAVSMAVQQSADEEKDPHEKMAE